MSNKNVCCICEKEMDGVGCSPTPFKFSRVCNTCDSYVSATRITLTPLVNSIQHIVGYEKTSSYLFEKIGLMLKMAHSLKRAQKEIDEEMIKEMKEDE